MAQIFNINGYTINPATEEKQDAIIAALTDSTNRVVPGSGQKMTCALTDNFLTVEEDAIYLVTAQDGRIFLGCEDGTSDDSSILWTIPAGGVMKISITEGTELHYFSDTADVVGRISQIE
jgi:hypothetical protein